MRKLSEKILCLSTMIFFLLLRGVVPADASGALGTGSVVFDPSNFAENLASALNTAATVENQVSQLYYTYKDLKSMPSSAWHSACGLLSNLSMIAAQLPGLSMTAQQLDTQFQTQNPGYSPSQNYQARQAAITSNFNTQLNNDLSQVNVAASGLSAGTCQLQYLNGMNTRGFGGKLQAIQTGTQVGILEVSTLQQMQSLQLQEAQEQRAYMAQRVASESTIQSSGKCFVKSGSFGVGHKDGSVSPPPSGCGPNGGACVQTTDPFGNTVYRPAAPETACAGTIGGYPGGSSGNGSSGVTAPASGVP